MATVVPPFSQNPSKVGVDYSVLLRMSSDDINRFINDNLPNNYHFTIEKEELLNAINFAAGKNVQVAEIETGTRFTPEQQERVMVDTRVQLAADAQKWPGIIQEYKGSKELAEQRHIVCEPENLYQMAHQEKLLEQFYFSQMQGTREAMGLTNDTSIAATNLEKAIEQLQKTTGLANKVPPLAATDLEEAIEQLGRSVRTKPESRTFAPLITRTGC